MKSLLFFLLALAGIALLGWTVSKITGAHGWLLEDWKFNDGETVLWRDDAADVGMIPRAAQAVVMRPPRLHRWVVIVTSQRIIISTKSVGGKQLVKYVLYPGAAPGADSKQLDGGLFTTGYETLVIRPGAITPHLDDKPPYIELTPAPDEPSSVNLSAVRIYTDLAGTFRLP
jgi:hypothetical protein